MCVCVYGIAIDISSDTYKKRLHASADHTKFKENYQMRPFSDRLKSVTFTKREAILWYSIRNLRVCWCVCLLHAARTASNRTDGCNNNNNNNNNVRECMLYVFFNDRRHRYRSANNIIYIVVEKKYGFCAVARLICLQALSFDTHFHHHFTIDSSYESLWVSQHAAHAQPLRWWVSNALT